MDNQSSLRLAIGFSGGGFRAASFSLGVLTYLDRIKVDHQSLLEKVVVLSTVSGGTIAGTRYAVGIRRGETLQEVYQSLYSFMSQVDLADKALERLVSDQLWKEGRVRSLINAFADLYDEHLFGQERFGLLLNDKPSMHLKHLSFNATEFDTANQFRFQVSEKIRQPQPGEPEWGIIGNGSYPVDRDVARRLRMGDILAASSCFPGGFEPINFPADFLIEDDGKKLDLNPVGLMDGGIVDNQGIEPILLAEKRMRRNREVDEPGARGNVLDLVIVSDVTSPYMTEYVVSRQKPVTGWRALTPAVLYTLNMLLLLGAGVGIIWAALAHHLFWIAVFAALFAVSLLFFGLLTWIKALPRKFHVPALFLQPLGRLLRLKLGVYESLVLNRSNSLLKLANDVFLKHVRRLNYRQVFEDPAWHNRRIMNAIYELREGESRIRQKVKDGLLPEYLVPGEKIQKVATTASAMGTTLWFTKEELERHDMLNALIACGQFTMCWNLLEYIEKIKRDPFNTTAGHQQLLACEPALRTDWEKFQSDPCWMEKIYNHFEQPVSGS